MTPEQAKALREPFAPDLVGKLPRVWCGDCRNARFKICDKHSRSKCRDCGGNLTTAHLHLDYVGHAEITDRLLAVDSEWGWEPVAFDTATGLPKVDPAGGLWIRLTVAGVTRLGYGHADGKTGPDAVKESIGDALRNAAMRFGVALDLWGAKFKEQDDAEAAHSTEQRPAATTAKTPHTPPSAPVIRDWVLTPHRTDTEILTARTKLLKEHPAVADTPVVNENGDDEQLSAFMGRWARQLTSFDEQEERRRKRMFALFRDLGYDGDTNRDQRHKIASHVLGRGVTSMKDVTLTETNLIITALEQRKQQGAAA